MTNENQEKITPIKNSEDHQKLVQQYETKITEHKQNAENWKNASIKSEEKVLESYRSQFFFKRRHVITSKQKFLEAIDANSFLKVYTLLLPSEKFTNYRR